MQTKMICIKSITKKFRR